MQQSSDDKRKRPEPVDDKTRTLAAKSISVKACINGMWKSVRSVKTK